MIRYLKIYYSLIKLNLAALLIYRSNFFASVFSNLLWGIFSIITMAILTSKTKYVMHWSRNELLLLIGFHNVIWSFFQIVFVHNFYDFSRKINKGTLDFYLLKPLDSQFLMSFSRIRFESLLRFIMGVGYVMYMLHVLHVPFHVTQVFFLIFIGIFSVVIFYSIWFLFSTLTIWLTRLSNISDMMNTLSGVSRYPPDIFWEVSLTVGVLLFPLLLAIATPVQILLQKNVTNNSILLILFSCLLLVGTRVFWKFALRYYTSANS